MPVGVGPELPATAETAKAEAAEAETAPGEEEEGKEELREPEELGAVVGAGPSINHDLEQDSKKSGVEEGTEGGTVEKGDDVGVVTDDLSEGAQNPASKGDKDMTRRSGGVARLFEKLGKIELPKAMENHRPTDL